MACLKARRTEVSTSSSETHRFAVTELLVSRPRSYVVSVRATCQSPFE